MKCIYLEIQTSVSGISIGGATGAAAVKEQQLTTAVQNGHRSLFL